jgi:Tol biopolymer transport system component
MAAGLALLWRGWRASLRLGLLTTLLLALPGCLLDRQPQPAPPPTATPTPRPTVTATPASLRVDRPPTAVVLPSTRPIATAARATPSELRGAGRLLYLGKLNGRQGIIATDADGTNRRLLVEGAYEAPVWSPDGSRFAAYGTTSPGNLPDQLAVFAPDGHALARFSISGVIAAPLAWSPDSRAILCLIVPPPADPRLDPPQALLMDDNGVREVALGQRAIPWRWTPGGRVAFRIPAASQQSNQLLTSAIWTVDPANGSSRREAAGTFLPAGWSPDGGTLYAIGAPPTSDQTSVPVDLYSPSSLLAFDASTGDLRVVIDANTLAARLSGTPPSAAISRWFVAAATAPRTGYLAIWLRSAGPPGVVLTSGSGETIVVIANSAGTPLIWERLPGTQPAVLFWSPTGQQLAYLLSDRPGPNLHILSLSADPPAIYGVAPPWLANGPPPAWSPDGRWIALAAPAGLTIAESGLGGRTLLLADDGQAPAWQPVTRP